MSARPLYVGPYLHFRGLPAFADLTPAQLRELTYEAQEVVLPRGSALLQEGQPCGSMYLVVDGVVDVHAGSVGPGGSVGFLELLSTAPVHASAVAATDVVALRVDTDAFRDICEQNFAVLSATLRYVAGLVVGDREALLRSTSGRGARPIEQTGGLDRVRRLLAFHRAPALPTVHMDALAELAGQVEELEAEAGSRLWMAGDDASHWFVVASGGVGLQWPDQRSAVELGPGAVPGLVETLAGRPYASSARTEEPTTLLRVEADPFLDVIEDHFEMAFGLASWLARHRLESVLGDHEASAV